MNKKLYVLWDHKPAGYLSQADGRLVFQYDAGWLSQTKAKPISISLPLSEKLYSHTEALPFFAGLLPEENIRMQVAKKLGISTHNEFAMLSALGEDCAGALQITSNINNLSQLAEDYEKVLLDNIIDRLPTNPLLAGQKNIRLSLAGAQYKLPIYIKDSDYYLALNGAPTSHIIKLPIAGIEYTVENEFFCLRLASALGLTTPEHSMINNPRAKILLVKRYDRKPDHGQLFRLHQEDFCQALGIMPENKYQDEGGPRLQDCFTLIDNYSALPVIDKLQLIGAVFFNMMIGNNDAHGKNFSIVYTESGARLAPFYDLLSTTIYPNLTKNFAMKFSGKRSVKAIHKRHIDQFAQTIGVSSKIAAEQLLKLCNKINEVAKKVADRHNLEDNAVISLILKTIEQNSALLMEKLT